MNAPAPRHFLAGIAVALCAATSPAQQVWPVANQQQLLAAFAAAAPGDVLQLAASGVFDSFTLTRGLTLRGPASIGGNSWTGGQRLVTVPPGQIAQFVDLTFRVDIPSSFPISPPLGVVEIRGSARFDNCTIEGSAFPAALHLINATVVLQRCRIAGGAGAAGVVATDSVLSIHDSSMQGARAVYAVSSYGSAASPGLTCSGNGSLHLSACTVAGGTGFFDYHYGPRAPATGLVTSVPSWIVESSVQGGALNSPYQMPSGTGLSATAATYARCSIQAGAGNFPGPAITGTATVDPALLGARLAAPLARGQAAALRLLADQPGVPVAVLATFGARAPVFVPIAAQALWLGTPTVFLAAGTTTNNADLLLSIPLPADPLLANITCDFIGLRLGGAGVQLTPPVGGVIR